MVRFCFVVAVALTIESQSARAQNDGAVNSARIHLDALRTGNYLLAAQTTDPEELRRVRADFEPLLHADSANYIARRLFRIESTAELRRLPDDAFYAGLMTFQFGTSTTTKLWSTMRGVELAGAIPKGEDTVLVVYKWIFAADSAPLRSFNVETMIRCSRGWCANMAGDFTGLLKLLKATTGR